MKKIFCSPITYLTFLFAFFFSNSAFSQDDIILNNNDVIKGKVEEVGVNVIKYRRADNLDGPIYETSKADVHMIVYANGHTDVMPASQDGDAPQADAQIRTAPPEMPVYEQPACPVEGYLWTPGYWRFGPGGYFWVPGVWVAAPTPGYLWTPGYWGYVNGYYGWHEGYWGEHIGFYGGVYYGYGYGGHGYDGGRWEGGHFRYNTAVNHVDVTIVHNTYVDNTVVQRNAGVSHASFNGQGGVTAQPNANEQRVAGERHFNPTSEQVAHVETAKSDKSQYASANGGKPVVTAMNKPGGQAINAEGKTAAMHPNSQSQAQHPAGSTSGHTNTPAANGHTNTPAGNGHTNTPANSHTNVPTNNGQHNSTPANGGAQQPHPGSNTLQQNNKQNIKPNTAAKPAPKPIEKKK